VAAGAAIYSRRYGIFFPPDTCHPERKRRISVRIAGDKIVSKYRSAGRLPFGSQVCVECLSALQRSTPLRHFVALSARRKHVTEFSVVCRLPTNSVPLPPGGKRVTGFSVVCRLPTNPVPLPPKGGRKGRYGIYLCFSSAAWQTAGAAFLRKGVAPLGDGG